MIEHRFGESEPFSLGVEEELMLLHAETLAPAPVAGAAIADGEEAHLPGALKHELFAAVLESNTPVSTSAGDVERCLRAMRRECARLASRHGAVVAAVGAHPFCRSEEQIFSSDARYKPMIKHVGPTARRQNVCGLHVHVGMPSPEACHRVLEGALPWLPVVLAHSANSPWLEGEVNGLLSNRAEALGLLPRNGAPPAFTSYDEWEGYVERLVAIGLVDDYRRLWWDIRPHPAYGTVELRAPDQPTAVRRSAAFAALFQALCATVLEDGAVRGAPGRRGDYVENRWRALHFGPRADMIHPNGDRLVPASELMGELVAAVRPAAERLGGDGLLDDLEPGRCEADAQLAAGDAHAAARDVVARSVESPS